MSSKLIAFLLCSCMLVGCKKQEAEPPVGMETFAQVYAEIVLQSQGLDSLENIARRDSILSAHGITPGELQAVVEAYQRDPEKWVDFFALVEKNLEEATSLKVTALRDTLQEAGGTKPDLDKK